MDPVHVDSVDLELTILTLSEDSFMAIWKRTLLAAAMTLLGTGSLVQAQSLGIGDPAPKLEVKSFVKGEPVSNLEPGKFYVVEFWATWCGPCIATIPHLTELQKKHTDVNFIGVSVWEQDQKQVKPFVEKMGDKMSYRVAIDAVPENEEGNNGAMAKNWMKAAGQNGIPTAFIVNKEGKVAWIGHPTQLDEPLEKVVTGSWDLQVAAAEHKKAMEERSKMMKLQTKLAQAMQADDPKKLLTVVDEVVAEIPRFEANIGGLKFGALVKLGETDKAIEYGKHLTKDVFGSNAQAYNALAWAVVDPDTKLKADPKIQQFAVETAEQADKLADRKDPAIADTLAAAYSRAGNKEKALETQERAVKLAKGTQMEQDKGMKSRLEEYRKAVKP
jgi:thiol-disulfide isomerase/thioredoxin